MDKPLLISIVLGYFLGSIPFTQIVAKSVKGIDLRQVGSKNVGGRNTAHNVGLGWGIFAGALDVLKGLAAMVCADKLGVPQAAQYWAGLAAIAGHNWPVWLGFRGGKGIAVTLGLLAWVAFPEALIVFFVGVILLRSTNNITITTLLGFGLLWGLTTLWDRPPQVSHLIVGSITIMLLAVLPDALRIARLPGGFKDYFRNPNKVYEDQQTKD